MSKHVLRALGGAVVVLGASVALGALPAGAGTLGTLTVNPSTGTGSTPLSVTTSGGCPSGATNVVGRITGGGFDDSPAAGAQGRNVVGNTDAGVSQSGPFTVTLSDTLDAFAAQNDPRVTLAGNTFVITLTCRTALNPASQGTFDAQLVFDSAGRFTSGPVTAQPSPTATATPRPSTSPTPRPTTSATPTVDFELERLSGSGRFETAARIATEAFVSAPTVILASGQSNDPATPQNEDRFSDALAANYLAGAEGAPTLLTTAVPQVPAATLAALDDLGAERVVIVGGTAVVPTSQEQQLTAAGYEVDRIAGPGRFDTAAAIARAVPTSGVGEDPNGDRTAVLASGFRFADALVAGPLAYAEGFPVMITAEDALSPQTRQLLQDLDIERVLIAGGTAVVSSAVEQQVAALGIEIERFAGANRSDTAAKIADYAYDDLGFDPELVTIATGAGFPDALAGGPLGGELRSPILLTNNAGDPGQPTLALLRARADDLASGFVLGGPSAVSDAFVGQFEDAVDDAR
jgi:putative cell wall-binding protein